MDATEAIEFYRWLGICVTVWAYIDRRLYQIFHHATGSEQKESAREFYANRQFKGRLKMITSAIRDTGQYVDEWLPLAWQMRGWRASQKSRP
jgi:hypothetical protein